MSTSSLSPEEVRAAAEIYRELGPDYQSAVVESFLDRVISEIDARVDGRIAAEVRASGRPAESGPARPPRHGQPAVIDGASRGLHAIFGEAGRHSRAAIGVAALPRGGAVEIEVTVAVVPDTGGV